MIENFYYSLKIDVENVGALTGYPLSLTVDGEDGVKLSIKKKLKY
jgi:hypothetical protein